MYQSHIASKRPPGLLGRVRLKSGESRITYHINHSITAMLIHSVYSSSKISERHNEKLFELSFKHTSLFASQENNLVLWRGEDCLIRGIHVCLTQKRGHVYSVYNVF